jgi:hypothetical protein
MHNRIVGVAALREGPHQVLEKIMALGVPSVHSGMTKPNPLMFWQQSMLGVPPAAHACVQVEPLAIGNPQRNLICRIASRVISARLVAP